MTRPRLPAAARLVEEIRALYAAGLEERELWRRIEQAQRRLLADSGLKRAA